MRLLLIEDDRKLADLLARGLREEGFAVDLAHDGEEGCRSALDLSCDAVILDVMLPGIDGFEILERIRSKGRRTPVLMLTSRGSVPDRVRGLNSGADDYLKKPFAFEELVARIHALVRRSAPKSDVCLVLEDLYLDPHSRTVSRGGEPIELTVKEFAVLEYLLRHLGNVISRTRLTEHVWDENFDAMSNVVDVTVYRLREKIDRRGVPLVHTVRGVGYVARRPEKT
ncbi:MAG: response regulator transcription factor [Verrucomicrobia bacterium]|nr:response regulator transcription factor [Verrucomicrobiota bacterium]